MESLGAQIPFKMQSRCDLMTRPTVGALRRAGCTEVWMGVESGAQDVLDAMDKGTRLWQVYEARENLRRHGIRACFFLQFGYPGETWAEIEKTIALVRETRPDDIGVSVSYPLPGTAFHQMVSSQLGPKENWADSDDLDMMFQGAFTTEFYRALADALHLEVREGRAAAEEAWAQRRWRSRKPARASCNEVTRMDLLLTHGYFLHEDPKELQIMKPYAPLGLLYLSSYLRAAGFAGGDLRFHVRFARRAVPHSGNGAAGDARHLREPDDSRQRAGDPASARWQCGWRVVVGGPEPANYAEQYLAAGAHVVVAGEGELALEAILRGVLAGAGSRPLLSGRRRQHGAHRPGATACRPGCAALARSRAHRYRPVPARLARTPRRGLGLRDHGARLPLSLPLVQPFHVRQDAPAPLARAAWWMKWSGSSTATSPSSCGSPTMCSRSTTAGWTSTPRR